MSLVDATLFIERIVTDEEFALELASLETDPQQVVLAVRGAGFDVTIDEVKEVFLERFGDVLDERELELIAAGAVHVLDDSTDLSFVVKGTLPTGTTAAAAAA